MVGADECLKLRERVESGLRREQVCTFIMDTNEHRN